MENVELFVMMNVTVSAQQQQQQKAWYLIMLSRVRRPAQWLMS